MDPKTDREWEDLRKLLHLVALPVTGHVRLVGQDCCRLELLARALSNWQLKLPAELQARLTPHQVQILAQLERQLARTCNVGGQMFD